MQGTCKSGGRTGQQGSALLIAIFALMLISVVGIALLVSTGTDSALAGNYRTATGAYYAAVGGLEEARGRMLWRNPDFINLSMPNVVPSPGGAPLAVNRVLYITNGVSGENVQPTATGATNSAPYSDTEYGNEFTWGLGGAAVQMTNSVSALPSLSLQGPPYKWVRINPVTEQALKIDVDGQGANDGTTPLYFDGSGLNRTSTGTEAFELTALAVMPDKSTKMLQYVVAPFVVASELSNPPSGSTPNLSFPAALTLLGNNVTFTGPGTSGFQISGQDQSSGCSPANYMVPSIGFINGSDNSDANILAGAQPASSYLGYPSTGASGNQPSTAPASILNVSQTMNPNWLNPVTLDAVAQNITNNADVVINGNATGSTILSKAPGMSPSNPMTIVVNGNVDFTEWRNTGYGLLLVTGTMLYDPNASWQGLVLVIGQGSLVSTNNGTGGITGAVVVAQTRDAAGKLLSSLGASSYQVSGSHTGTGIVYNSCVVNAASGPLTYQILAFREITQ